MSQSRLDLYNQLPLSGIGYRGNEISTVAATEIHLGGSRITEEDLVKFRKLLDFMDFALGASEELRNLMVAYEAKQRILK